MDIRRWFMDIKPDIENQTEYPETYVTKLYCKWHGFREFPTFKKI